MKTRFDWSVGHMVDLPVVLCQRNVYAVNNIHTFGQIALKLGSQDQTSNVDDPDIVLFLLFFSFVVVGGGGVMWLIVSRVFTPWTCGYLIIFRDSSISSSLTPTRGISYQIEIN